MAKTTELPLLPFESKSKWADWLAKQHDESIARVDRMRADFLLRPGTNLGYKVVEASVMNVIAQYITGNAANRRYRTTRADLPRRNNISAVSRHVDST